MPIVSALIQFAALVATAKIAHITYRSTRLTKKTDLALKYQDRWNAQEMLNTRHQFREMIREGKPWRFLSADEKKNHVIPLLNFLLELTRFMQRADLIDRATVQIACPEAVQVARDLYHPKSMWLENAEIVHYRPIAILPAYFTKPEVKRSILYKLKNKKLPHKDDELKPHFDADYYFNKNKDVREAGVDGFDHFMKFGWHERRNPSPHFDIKEYLRAYQDVFDAGINPLQHYIAYGRHQGFDKFEVMHP